MLVGASPLGLSPLDVLSLGASLLGLSPRGVLSLGLSPLGVLLMGALQSDAFLARARIRKVFAKKAR